MAGGRAAPRLELVDATLGGVAFADGTPCPARSSNRTWARSIRRAEIRAEGEDGACYAAPDLVIHYIAEHRYCPPEEFCQAAVRAAGFEAVEVLTLAE